MNYYYSGSKLHAVADVRFLSSVPAFRNSRTIFKSRSCDHRITSCKIILICIFLLCKRTGLVATSKVNFERQTLSRSLVLVNHTCNYILAFFQPMVQRLQKCKNRLANLTTPLLGTVILNQYMTASHI